MGDKREPDAADASRAPRRKPYRAPKLERLGTLSEITAAVATNGKNDHAGPHATFRKS